MDNEYDTKNSEPDEADQSAPQSSEARNSRRSWSGVDELLGAEVCARARRANVRLREQLTGTVLVRLRASNKKFLFDWRTEDVKSGPTTEESADCIIDTNDDTLLKITDGDLNPQISMLSDRIHVSGKLSLAIYFFNLLAPRVGV